MLVTTVKGQTCSNYKVKVNMNIVAIADGLIKLEAIIIYNYTSPHSSIYYIVALKVHLWCTKVLWACSMQAEYMFVSSTHHQGLVTQQILLQQRRPFDLKGIESDCHSSIHKMFVLVIINAMMNLKQFGPLVLICVETIWPGS